MTLIALSGKSGSGKDTLAAEMVEHLGFTRIAFADRLKTEVQSRCILPTRRRYQMYGQRARERNPLHWIQPVMSDILAEPDRRWVITDMRYVNEARQVLAYDGDIICIVRLTLDGQPLVNLKAPECNHESEREPEYIYPLLSKGWGLRMHQLAHRTEVGLKVTGMSVAQQILDLPFDERIDIAKLYANEIAEAVDEE